MVVDVGFALVWLVVPIVGKRVFLLVVSTIPTVMRCMTPSAATVKKAAFGRSKSPAFAGTKTAANRGPSSNPPESPSPSVSKGRELIPADFKDVVVLLLPLGEGWDGASRLGWASMLDGAHPWQLCRSCDFIAQGLGVQRLYPGYIYNKV